MIRSGIIGLMNKKLANPCKVVIYLQLYKDWFHITPGLKGWKLEYS